MSTPVRAAPFKESRGGTLTGTALSTTLALIPIPLGTSFISLLPRNLSTAVVAGFLLNPELIIFKTTDLLSTPPTDYSLSARDADAGTDIVLSSIPTIANGGALYVGSAVPFGGVAIDIDAANGTASVLTVKYWNGSAWADISDTDGTISTGASMAQDGNVTWTVPSAWVPTSLIASGDAPQATKYGNQEMYWTRWEWSTALDSSTTLNSMLPINRSTAYTPLIQNEAFEFSVDESISCIQAVTDAGTASLLVRFFANERFK